VTRATGHVAGASNRVSPPARERLTVEVRLVGIDAESGEVRDEQLTIEPIADAAFLVRLHLLERLNRAPRSERPSPTVEDTCVDGARIEERRLALRPE